MAQDSSSKVPTFYASYYALWEVMMKTYLLCISVNVWASVENDFHVPTNFSIDANVKKDYEMYMEAKFTIFNSFFKDVFSMVMHCKSSKEVWDKLRNTYHGNDRVKEAKIQNLKERFKDLKMRENEKVEDYLVKIEEITSSIRGHGEKMEDIDIVKNVLRSLPYKFDSKISAIEEAKDIKKYTG